MPEISRFSGGVITMYYNDHPPPHFHVRYNKQKALINIETLEVLQGNLPTRLLRKIQAWASFHQSELRENWRLASKNQPLNTISSPD